MNGTASRFVRFWVVLLGLVTLGCVLTGNAAKPARQSLVTDWSHHHLIFSHTSNPKRAQQLQDDPRFQQQLLRQTQRRMLPVQVAGAEARSLPSIDSRFRRKPRMHRDWSEDLGTGASAGAGTYPAKFSFDVTTADCTNDFVVYSTGLPGSGTQASIVAFNNLYSGCISPPVPSVLWAYETSPIPARILTSPVLSLDGSQLAFVQTDGPNAQLVLLKWKANVLQSVTAPGIPATVPLLAYRLCIAPCMTTINLTDHNNAHTDDRTSSVFIDYKNDKAWVGDSGGNLHQFTDVFSGTPAEVRDATWPVSISSSSAGLTSPVYDRITGNVFVGGLGNGVLYHVNSSNGVVNGSAQLDFANGIMAGPVVDTGNQTVYVSVGNDGSGTCLTALSVSVDCAGVFQLSTSFGSGAGGTEVKVGISTDHTGPPLPKPMYNGFFDNAYLNSPNGTGNYYVCGNTGDVPTLYQVPINGGAFGTPVTVSILTRTQNQPCSPVVDVFNPNTTGGPSERVFASAQADGWPNNCISAAPGGCLMNFVVTQWQPLTAYTAGQEVLVRSLVNPNVLFIQTVQHAGTSGPTPPAWGAAPDIVISDPPGFLPPYVGWLNQGRIDATPILPWSAGLTAPFVGDRILDSNGNIELVDVAGTTAGTQPVWPTTVGAITVDGTMTWREAGPVATVALPAAGGTSGIIIDNIVGSGTQPGASQIYFSTLSDQTCGTSGTGGCAVQVSQPGLQ